MSATERMVRGLSIDPAVDLERRRAMLEEDQLAEIDHQFQVPISGVATSTMTWAAVQIEFDAEFFYAPEQRDSPLTMPHFTYGAVVQAELVSEGMNTIGAVTVSAVVLRWTIDEARNAITGARVGIGTAFEGTTTPQFHGTVHLTFQGYGALAENDEILNVGS